MSLGLPPGLQAFRDEVRDFLATRLPPDTRRQVYEGLPLDRETRLGWQRILHARGWGAPAWPVEYGGTGWTALQQHIYDEESALAYAPEALPFGLKMVAPVLMKYGSPAQRQRFLPGIIEGRDWWCQGYSEPDAGSDLASLKTSAVRDGDHYIVNGQKTWTTLAQYADWMFCLVRTDREAKRQRGISFLLIDMRSPGIEVRPIRMLDGGHEINEVWLDSVRVPIDNLVGEENQGWTYAKYLLEHERSNIARVGQSKAALQRLRELVRRQPGYDGAPLIDDPRFRDRMARVALDLQALEVIQLRLVSAGAVPGAGGPQASILKLLGSQAQQMLGELSAAALGAHAAADLAGAAPGGHASGLEVLPPADQMLTSKYFNLRKATIYGGASEVQKILISRHLLG